MRILNLNNYLITTEDEASLKIIVPDIEGLRQLPLWWKSKKAKKQPLIDITNAEWSPTIQISTIGTPEEYCKRVNWWFDNKTDDYKQLIEEIYGSIPDLIQQIKRSKGWLLTTAAYTQNSSDEYFKRKSDINKFFRTWLNKQLKNVVRR